MSRRPSRAKQLAAAMRENVRIPRECHPATLRVLVQRGHAHLFDGGFVLEAELGRVLESLALGERAQLGIADDPDRKKILYSFGRLEGFVKFIRRNRPLVNKLIHEKGASQSAH